MYRQKSEIIEQIQSYHEQVARLYHELHEKAEDQEIKSLIFDLYSHEKGRGKYLFRHKKIAEAMNCWLDFPCDKLSNQITECFRNNINPESVVTMEDLIKIELYFDDCLIKIYNILASENELSETVANTFYYMLKKTRKEQDILAKMLFNSKHDLNHKFSVLNI
jgi:hypothetical protein